MPYQRERDMYPSVCNWLSQLLFDKYKTAQVRVFDSSLKSLSRLVQDHGLMAGLPSEWPTWDIQVDVVGFVSIGNKTSLAFVECKNEPIKLIHLSQLLGYSRVALPISSYLISPHGPSDSLRQLLKTFMRTDILRYDFSVGLVPRTIIIAKWNELSGSIDQGSIITGDSNMIGRH